MRLAHRVDVAFQALKSFMEEAFSGMRVFGLSYIPVNKLLMTSIFMLRTVRSAR